MTNLKKWLAGTVVVLTSTSLLAGCFVEERPVRHAHHRDTTIIVR